jgi:hypothetical protein
MPEGVSCASDVLVQTRAHNGVKVYDTRSQNVLEMMEYKAI